MTTLAEPEWDEATRALVLDFADLDLCPICGGMAEECQDPARQFDWAVPAPVRCHRKTALLERQQGVDEKTNPHAAALIWSVGLREELAGG